MAITFNHEIRGYVVGALWWPSGAEAYKPLAYDLTREDARFGEPATLRDHLLHIIGEDGGDFQGAAAFGDCQLVTTATATRGARVYRRTRVTDLESCGSVRDLIMRDWCGPCDGDDQ